MNRKQYITFLEEKLTEMLEIAKKKSHDYSSFSDSVFANFEVVGLCGIASVEQGFLTRMMDKISRINSFVKQGITLVDDEKIDDTLVDLSSYALLMLAYIKSKRNDTL